MRRTSYLAGAPGRSPPADVVVWSRELVGEELVSESTHPTAELATWPPLSPALLEVYDRARRYGLTVARVHGGDPTICGRVHEEIDSVTERGLAYEVIPGVTALAAAAAASGCSRSRRGSVGRLALLRRHGLFDRRRRYALFVGDRAAYRPPRECEQSAATSTHAGQRRR